MEEHTKRLVSTLTTEDLSSTAKLAQNDYTLKSDVGSTRTGQEKNGFVLRQLEHSNTVTGSLIHLLKNSLGTGMLAMPHAFKNGGLAFGFVGTIVVGIICTYGVHILVKVSQEICIHIRAPSLGFSETSEAAFKYGPKRVRKFSTAARWTCDIALVTTYFMCNGVYVVFVADSMEELARHWFPGYSLSKTDFILIIMGGLLITSQVRELKHLVPFSFCANVFMVVAFLITLYYMFNEIPDPSDKKLIFDDVRDLPAFFSTVIFALEGIGVVMPVENTMDKPQYFLGCPGVLNVVMGIVILVFSTIGFFGYLKFGEETYASITYNLPVDEIPAQLVKLLIGLAVFFTYSLQMYVVVDIIWKNLIVRHATTTIKRNVFQIILRCTFVVGTVGVALGVPDLENIIGLVGAVCFSTLGLLIPSIVETVWRWDNLGPFKWIFWKNFLIGAFSIFALVSGSARSIDLLINNS